MRLSGHYDPKCVYDCSVNRFSDCGWHVAIVVSGSRAGNSLPAHAMLKANVPFPSSAPRLFRLAMERQA